MLNYSRQASGISVVFQYSSTTVNDNSENGAVTKNLKRPFKHQINRSEKKVAWKRDVDPIEQVRYNRSLPLVVDNSNVTVHWPNKTIPYEISPKITGEHRQWILNVIKENFHARTCLKFREKKDSDKNYVFFQSEPYLRCYHSQRGFVPGKSFINMALPDCEHDLSLLTAILSIIGLWYEHRRSDRDDYVIVNFNNIKPEYRKHFVKHEKGHDNLHIRYDFNSIMHFPSYEYAINTSEHTIESIILGKDIFPWDTLTKKDFAKIFKLYDCGEIDAELLESTTFHSLTLSSCGSRFLSTLFFILLIVIVIINRFL